MKYFNHILLLAIGLSLSTSVAFSQGEADEQPATTVEAYAKTLDVKPCTLDVMVIESMPTTELELSNIAITTKKSTALAYVLYLPMDIAPSIRQFRPVIHYSEIHKGRLIHKTIKAPPLYS